jgi:hypothetical protein
MMPKFLQLAMKVVNEFIVFLEIIGGTEAPAG